MNWVSIGSGNGLSPVWYKYTLWTNADVSSVRPLGSSFNEILIKCKTFHYENAANNAIGKVVAIVARCLGSRQQMAFLENPTIKMDWNLNN